MEHLPMPKLPCLCGNFRRSSRALTQLYENALRPVNLRATQFTILQALTLAGEVTQSQLGEMLVMDSTTLSRTLRIMAREGWIAERRGNDRRERWLAWLKAGKLNSSVLCRPGRKFNRACAINWESWAGKTFSKSHIRSQTW
jgi:hypothetical protein